MFTIFKATDKSGIPNNIGMAESTSRVKDSSFTDDFDTGQTEYEVDENILDLSDAEAEGFGISVAAGAMGVDNFEFDVSGMDGTPSMENAGPDHFDLDLSNDLADSKTVTTEILEAEPVTEASNTVDPNFGGKFDEGEEGLSFGTDESPAEEAQEENTAEISLDANSDHEVSLELELGIDDEEPSLERLDDLDLSVKPKLMDISEESDLMDAPMEESVETEDNGEIEFDLDGVDLDELEKAIYEVPEAETSGEEPFMSFDELELGLETSDEPEDEELTR